MTAKRRLDDGAGMYFESTKTRHATHLRFFNTDLFSSLSPVAGDQQLPPTDAAGKSRLAGVR